MALVVAFMVIAIGSTIMSFGPEPKEHFSLALMHTHFGIGTFYGIDIGEIP